MKSDDLAEHAAEAEAFLKAFGNQSRLAILCNLQQGERSVSEIGSVLGLHQATLSQHLARLRGDRLVKTRRDAQTIYYSLADPRAERMIGLLHEMFCSPDCASEAAPKRRRVK